MSFDQILASLESELEHIEASDSVGITYVAGRQKVEVYDQDPALKEAVVEYYRTRIRQMQTFSGQLARVIYPVQED